MKTSNLFDGVMSLIWDEGGAKETASTEARAVASYVKNHRVNSENACEVLEIMWPQAIMKPRPNGEGVTCDDPADVWFDIQFEDGSQVLMMTRRGIGTSLGVVS